MGYVNKTDTVWSEWRLPRNVAQNMNVGKPWSNLDNIKTSKDIEFAKVEGINANTPTTILYAYDYGFDTIVPEGVKILKVETRLKCASDGSSATKIYTGHLRLRTADNNTYAGWAEDYNTHGGYWTQGTISDQTMSKSAIGSTDKNSSWGPSDIQDFHVRRSNFGCVMRARVENPTGNTNGVLSNISMRVQYETVKSVWQDPVYTLNSVLSPSNVKADGSNSSKLTITNQNTNNTNGSLQIINVKINSPSICCFADGTSSKTINSRSTNAGQTITDTLNVIGLSNGTSTITVTCGNNTKTVSLVVGTGVIDPIYSCSPVLSNNIIKKGNSTVLNLSIKNTNNVQGTLAATTISTTGKAKLLVNNTQVNTATINSSIYGPNETKTYPFTIVGGTVGQDTITIKNNNFGTKTLPITINTPDPKINIAVAYGVLFIPDEPTDMYFTIQNVGEVPAPLTSLVLTATDPIRFPTNLTTKTINLNKTLAAGSSENVKVDFVGLAPGKGKITGNLTGYGSSTCEFNFSQMGVYSSTLSVTPSELDVGGIFQLKFVYTNTNDIAGYTPETTVNLPAGITTLDGKTSYTFNRTWVERKGSVTFNVSLTASTEGTRTITVAGKSVTVKVNKVVIPTPVISDNWAYSSKTGLFPNDTGQLIVAYTVMNDVYPAMIPATTITLSGTAIEWTSGGTGSKTVTLQNLQKGESYSNENDNQIFFKFKSPGNSTITLTNSLLGTRTIKISTEYRGAEFVSSASITPNTIKHVEGGAIINGSINNTNIGDTSGVLPGTVVSLTGGVLEFMDGKTTKVLADRTIESGKNIIDETLIRTKTDGTGTIRFTNETSKCNQDFTVIVEPPLVAEYNISMTCSQPNIPIWGDDQVSSALKIIYTNTNLLAGSTPIFTLYLEGSLTFTNGASSVVIPSQNIGLGGTLEYDVPLEVKSNTVGTFTMRLYDSVEDADICECTIDVMGARPVNKGWVNIEDCEFETNSASIGGAVCNRGKLFSTNLKFKNNTVIDKCPNIWDNGACK